MGQSGKSWRDGGAGTRPVSWGSDEEGKGPFNGVCVYGFPSASTPSSGAKNVSHVVQDAHLLRETFSSCFQEASGRSEYPSRISWFSVPLNPNSQHARAAYLRAARSAGLRWPPLPAAGGWLCVKPVPRDHAAEAPGGRRVAAWPEEGGGAGTNSLVLPVGGTRAHVDGAAGSAAPGTEVLAAGHLSGTPERARGAHPSDR